MPSSLLNEQIDRAVEALLTERRLPRRVMRVIFTGATPSDWNPALQCLEALHLAGFTLTVTLSHSAGQTALSEVCGRWQTLKRIPLLMDDRAPADNEPAYYGVFLPGLSINSLAKMALCLRDNLACQWGFHALAAHKPVFATLSGEMKTEPYQHSWQCRRNLSSYIHALEEYGVVFSGSEVDCSASHRPVLTVADLCDYGAGEVLHLDRRCVITPAARDEIRRLHMTIEPIN